MCEGAMKEASQVVKFINTVPMRLVYRYGLDFLFKACNFRQYCYKKNSSCSLPKIIFEIIYISKFTFNHFVKAIKTFLFKISNYK